MTRGQLRAKALRKCLKFRDAMVFPATDTENLNAVIQEALDDFCVQAECLWVAAATFSTVAGQAEYDLEQLVRIAAVSDVAVESLALGDLYGRPGAIAPRDVEHLPYGPTSQGRPLHWHPASGSSIRFVPVPDAVYTCRASGYGFHPLLTDDADPIRVPRSAETGVTAYVAGHFLNASESRTIAQVDELFQIGLQAAESLAHTSRVAQLSGGRGQNKRRMHSLG